MYNTIRFEVQDKIARITFNRPDRFNSFNEEMSSEFIDALKVVAKDPEIRVAVLSGEGKAFNAGQDLTITLPNNVITLNGTVTDDGLPIGSALTITWNKASGPGTVTFGNPDQAITTATFSVAGSYVLRLSAGDSQLSSSDDVTITVSATPPVNQPPVVNAGSDQTITLPTNTVNLNGAVTDDGLPTGSTLIMNWSKVSGPGTVTFSNPNGAIITATFSAAGKSPSAAML